MLALRKEIRRLLREQFLQEFIGNDAIYLRQYFSMTEAQKKYGLPYEYSYFFKDFLIEKDIEFQMPKTMRASMYMDEPDEEVDEFEDDEQGLISWIEKNRSDIFDQFANHLYQRINDHSLAIPEAELPAWSYFDENPKLAKNQWLVHFTNNADDIASQGFKYGVSDMTKLGLTTSLGEFEKKYGGYNFAYKLSDFRRYGYVRHDRYKYGKEAVIFRASGLELWHHGDQEPQIIFYGNTAKDIIPITKGENFAWAIYSKITRKLIYEHDDLDVLVDWLVAHYAQYRKHL